MYICISKGLLAKIQDNTNRSAERHALFKIVNNRSHHYHINMRPTEILLIKLWLVNPKLTSVIVLIVLLGSQMTEWELCVTETFNSYGKGVGEIARDIGRSHNVIGNFLCKRVLMVNLKF